MTPGELFAVVQGHQRQQITAAWWHEFFARQERLEPLGHYLEPEREPTRGIDALASW